MFKNITKNVAKPSDAIISQNDANASHAYLFFYFNVCLISLGVLHCCELLEDDESKITVLNAAKLPLKSTIAAVKVKNKHQIPFFQY